MRELGASVVTSPFTLSVFFWFLTESTTDISSKGRNVFLNVLLGRSLD